MIKKTANGKYQVRIFYFENGQKKSKTKTFANKVMANKFEVDMEVKKSEGSLDSDARMSMPEYFWGWFETYKRATLSPATIERYHTTYNLLKKELGSQSLAGMNRIKYQKFLNNYAADHSKASVSKLHIQIAAAISDAVIDGYIKKDFTVRVTISGGAGASADTKFLNMADTEKLMRRLEGSEDIYTTSHAMIYTALFTGMRLSEVQGLTEDDFFPKFKRVQVNKTLDRNLEFKPTKNKSSVRVIDIPSNLVDYLQKLIDMQHQFNNYSNPKKLIFMNKRGDVPSSNSLKKVLARLLKEIKAEKIITFHGLRHTHASYLLAKGSKIEYVSKRLGHANIQTTMHTYQHMLKEVEDNEVMCAINFLEEAIKPKKDEQRHTFGTHS